MSALPNNEVAILNAALELATGERAAYLDQACAFDPALRKQVEGLLQANDQAGEFLETPPEGLDFQRTTPVNIPPNEKTGDRIDRYKLLQQIGEGGCGVVYMAEQEEPVRRRVALKVIKLGMDTKNVIARFEAERQALALMDHPNIAKVLDAGATEAGRPYFVMELVRGVKITDYCDQNNLPTRERLDLFIQVCLAIQHAHQKGIIHRDIKPSNILVSINDDEAVPKVIDFGIAKATEGRLTNKTLFTRFEALIGTPAYMSPEQALMTSLDIDTRTDIYSLGVLLYELLTGQTPFDGKELLASGLDEMRKTIRDKEPVRPSTRLTHQLTAVAATHEGAEAVATDHSGALTRRRYHRLKETITLLRGDLDWIVMKCLEKDRARRYETANGLASDIQRHLNNEAVLARPPTAAYRFQKLVRRNKRAVAAVAIVTLTLIAGLGFSTWAFVREAADAEKARQAEQRAESAAAAVTRNLYFAEMTLAGNAAAEPGGISRITDLTAKWLPEKGVTDLRGWEWYYLQSLLHFDRLTLNGHSGAVQSVAWSPDGKRLASGGEHTIKVWDAKTGQIIQNLLGHDKWVKSVSWRPDGKRLASGSDDTTIRVWDAKSGQIIQNLLGHEKSVNSVSWSPNGESLASGSDDTTIKIWDAGSGTNILTLPGHTNPVLSVAWSPDGKRLASASWDGMIKVWDVESRQVLHNLTGHEYWVPCVSWSPDGKRLASGGADYMVRVWDAVGGTLINTLKGHFDAVDSVSWSPDGQRLASGCEDNTIKVWDAIRGTNTFTHRGHNKYVFSVAWSPDGEQLASGSEDRTIKIWDASREETLTLRGHTNEVFSVAWSPDGKRLASASFDSTIKVWDPDRAQESRTLRGHTDKVSSVAWSPDGKFLLSGSRDSTIKVWDIASGRNTITHRGHNQYVSAVAWSADGTQFGSVSEDHTIHLYDATSGQVTLALLGHSNTVHSLAWSPDGKFLASGSWDRTLKVWDAVSGQAIHTLRDERSGGFTTVAWSRDGKHLAVGGFDKMVRVLDVATWQVIHTLSGHSGGVLSVSWGSNGRRLASSSFDGTVKIWDTATGHEALTLRGHALIVQSVSWSPDGQRLASGSYDHTVKIWDARKGYALERK